jgi:hypothetical protein
LQLGLTPIQPARERWRGLTYGRSALGFTLEGFDEMGEVSGDGSAELLNDGSIEIETPITMATKPSSKPNATLRQQPACPRSRQFQ